MYNSMIEGRYFRVSRGRSVCLQKLWRPLNFSLSSKDRLFWPGWYFLAENTWRNTWQRSMKVKLISSALSLILKTVALMCCFNNSLPSWRYHICAPYPPAPWLSWYQGRACSPAVLSVAQISDSNQPSSEGTGSVLTHTTAGNLPLSSPWAGPQACRQNGCSDFGMTVQVNIKSVYCIWDNGCSSRESLNLQLFALHIVGSHH